MDRVGSEEFLFKNNDPEQSTNKNEIVIMMKMDEKELCKEDDKDDMENQAHLCQETTVEIHDGATNDERLQQRIPSMTQEPMTPTEENRAAPQQDSRQPHYEGDFGSHIQVAFPHRRTVFSQNRKREITVWVTIAAAAMVILVILLVVTINNYDSRPPAVKTYDDDDDSWDGGYDNEISCPLTVYNLDDDDDSWDGGQHFCDKDQHYCWHQLGPDVVADETTHELSFDDDALSMSADGTRFAVTFWDPDQDHLTYTRVYDLQNFDADRNFFVVGQQLLHGDRGGASMLSRNGRRLAILNGYAGPEYYDKSPLHIYEFGADQDCQWKQMECNDIFWWRVHVAMSYDGSIVAIQTTYYHHESELQSCEVEVFRNNDQNGHWELRGSMIILPALDNGCTTEISSDGSILAIMTDSVHIFRFKEEEGWVGGHVSTQVDQYQGDKTFDFMLSLSSTGNDFAVFAQSHNFTYHKSSHPFLYSFDPLSDSWQQVNIEEDHVQDPTTTEPAREDSVEEILLSESGRRLVVKKRLHVKDISNHEELHIYDMVNGSWVQLGDPIVFTMYNGDHHSPYDTVRFDLGDYGRRLLICQWGDDNNVMVQLFECSKDGIRCDKA